MRNVKPPTAKFPSRALRGTGTVHTVRLQALMEQQQKAEIGQRIRELREASPHTNRSIADEIGVSERAVTGWISGRGIGWDNVVAVAQLFDRDPHWLWSGQEKGKTPDLMAELSPNGSTGELREAVEALHGKVDQILANQAALLEAVDRVLVAQESSQPTRKQAGRRRKATGS